MSDSQRRPGGIDETQVQELDLPDADDPVAWNYVEPGTEVVDPGGEVLGKVAAMLGTEAEGIFHGVAVEPSGGGPNRVVPADDVVSLTPSRVVIGLRAEDLEALEVPDRSIS
jgi:hypothetical protein